MERLSLEITKYDALIDNEPKEQNQLSFSVENIRTMEDWQDVVTKISGIMVTLNGKYRIEVEQSFGDSFREAQELFFEKHKDGNQDKTFAEKLQEKIQENKNKNQ